MRAVRKGLIVGGILAATVATSVVAVGLSVWALSRTHALAENEVKALEADLALQRKTIKDFERFKEESSKQIVLLEQCLRLTAEINIQVSLLQLTIENLF